MYPLQVDGIGMVTSLGLNRHATSAAFRAGLDNFQESHFIDGNGDNLFVAEIPLEKPWRGRVKMLKMAAIAIAEAVEEANLENDQDITTLICLPEQGGLGLELDAQDFFHDLQKETGLKFSQESGLLLKGKAGCVSALKYAYKIIAENPTKPVMIIATDTLLTARIINAFTEKRWLLTKTTSNSFTPGEGAVCIILRRKALEDAFNLLGIGKADEAYVEGEEKPFLAEGMTKAIGQALNMANLRLDAIDLWFSHNTTSYLSAKEITLAELKLLRGENIQFQRSSLTQSFGEIGAAAGLLMLALSRDLLPKGGISLVTMANFAQSRAVILCDSGGNYGK